MNLIAVPVCPVCNKTMDGPIPCSAYVEAMLVEHWKMNCWTQEKIEIELQKLRLSLRWRCNGPHEMLGSVTVFTSRVREQ